mmetsp:Transcript_19397/g.65440  ORF Transcript_19397/g.65440 Transcript_19397/m.65440 type:complete len:217 (-) Transcript_19397:138-788(-)
MLAHHVVLLCPSDRDPGCEPCGGRGGRSGAAGREGGGGRGVQPGPCGARAGEREVEVPAAVLPQGRLLPGRGRDGQRKDGASHVARLRRGDRARRYRRQGGDAGADAGQELRPPRRRQVDPPLRRGHLLEGRPLGGRPRPRRQVQAADGRRQGVERLRAPGKAEEARRALRRPSVGALGLAGPHPQRPRAPGSLDHVAVSYAPSCTPILYCVSTPP